MQRSSRFSKSSPWFRNRFNLIVLLIPSSMTASVLARLIFLFALPCFSVPCTPALPCNPSIQIRPPFYYEADSEMNSSCQGYLEIGCNQNEPFLVGLSKALKLESISYSMYQIRVQDPYLSSSLQESGCGNLYFEFQTPVSDFNHKMYNSLNASLPSVRCTRPPNQIQSPPNVFEQDYNLSYSPIHDKDDDTQQNCSIPDDEFDASFEFILLFKDDSRELSLQSANYSSDRLAQLGCFAGWTEVFNKGYFQLERNNRMRIIIGAAAGLLTFVITCLILIVKLQTRKSSAECILSRKYSQGNIHMLLEKCGLVSPKRYKYGEVKTITKSFQDILGKGGFGTVYKGRLPDGRLVAVKILHSWSNHGEEFLNEVLSIGRTSHVNVVSLLGFCIEGSKHALIYEYMSNGSLDNYIFSENSKSVLGLEKLYQIAIGIARGLEYLHRGCNTRIVHFDIKPQNILLDEDFNPKISDFGLAKLCPPKESILSMAEMRGTIGYIAPEVFSRSFGVVSAKSDVYSYGMMVLEMVGGRRNAKPSAENESQVFFPHWLYDRLAEGCQIQASDVSIEIEEIVKKMGMVGLWCTQTIPASRPSMSRVVEMLQGDLDELEMPPKPFSFSPAHSTQLSVDTTSTSITLIAKASEVYPL